MTVRKTPLLSSIASVAGLLLLAATGAPAVAGESIKVGQTPDASVFYLPTYIAADRGIFREEGLDVTFITRDDERDLTAAGVGRAIDFVPDAGGARISIKGAPVRYIVGQAQISPWVIAANPDSVRSVEELKGGTLGLGPRDTAAYEQTASILSRFFGLKETRDYKTVDAASAAGRLAALIDGRIQGALISWRDVPKAGIAGMDIILKTGHYLPRLEGAYWVTADYLEQHPDTVRRFIRAIARATLYLATEQIGSIEVIQQRFKMESLAEANVLWNAMHREFDPAIPAELLRQAFVASATQLRVEGLWPNNRPIPAVEQFIASDIMKTALREIGY